MEVHAKGEVEEVASPKEAQPGSDYLSLLGGKAKQKVLPSQVPCNVR